MNKSNLSEKPRSDLRTFGSRLHTYVDIAHRPCFPASESSWGGVLANVRSPSHTFQMAVCDLISILSLTTHIASASLSSPGPIPGWMVVLYHILGGKIKREFSIHEKKFQSPFPSPFPLTNQNCRAPPQNLPRPLDGVPSSVDGLFCAWPNLSCAKSALLWPSPPPLQPPPPIHLAKSMILF